MTTITRDYQSLKLNFKEDTLTTVSRDALRALAKKLGFNETQTVLFALARLRDEVLQDQDAGSFLPLTKAQLSVIAKAEPKAQGKVVDTLL
jgi:hypothetical protein